MKKIIFFAKNLCIGGMEKSLVILLNSIDFNMCEVTLVLEENIGKLKENINENIRIIDYKLCKDKNVFIRKTKNAIKKLIFAIKNYNRYDCSIDYATYSIICSQLARLSSKNSILYVHSDYYNVYNGKEKDIKNFFNLINAEKFKKILFVSKHAMENLRSILPKVVLKGEVLGNLVDYKTIEDKANEYEVEFDDGVINIVFVGRLEEESKNISKLIETVNKSKYKEKFKLYIIGDGPDKNKYEEMKLSDNIIFFGELENPYPYIKGANYLILCSKYEGFPVVYNEANVLDTQIITTIPVEDEEIIYDKKNVLLLDKQLLNFEKIIHEICNSKDKVVKNKINFAEINKHKTDRIYKLLEV